MKAILKMAQEYKWYDPLIDSPIPQSRDERRALAGRLTVGTIAGGAIGGGLALALDVAKYKKGLKKNTPAPFSVSSGNLLAATSVGLAAGGLTGSFLGGRKILKRRAGAGLPLYSPEEEAMKLKLTHQSGGHTPGSLIVYSKR